MKKENQQLAKTKKAAQKKKEANAKLVKKFSMFVIPALILIGLIAWSVVQGINSNPNSYKLSADSSLEIKLGDMVNIDFVGSIDGVEFEGGSTEGQGTALVVGSKKYIDDFEEQLVGAHPGDEVDVNVTFPEDYGKEDLNGKDALFKVKVNGIYVKK
jgi:trigger factor